jgi:cobalamin biosynthesis Mg chelatase CobN
VLALLASACLFPAVAQAETVYDPEPTTIPGETKPKHPKPKDNSSGGAEAGASGSESTAAPAGSGGGSSGGDGSSVGTSASTDTGKDTGQGNRGNGVAKGDSAAKPREGISPAATVETSDDGSSPLVPILIAVAVLAAISIGAVVARRRRGLGGSVSPKAS